MTRRVEVVVIGGGQAGLAISHYLTQQGRDHVVLEQATQVGSAWRDRRWDSFTLVTPNWTVRLPGFPYRGDDPDGFMTRAEVVEPSRAIRLQLRRTDVLWPTCHGR